MKQRSVVELAATYVTDEHLFEGASACEPRLGIFSDITTAVGWLRASIAKGEVTRIGTLAEIPLLYFTASSIWLDRGEKARREIVLNRDGSVRGEIKTTGGYRPWGGRPEPEWAFKPGELVACLDTMEAADSYRPLVYRIGIVLAGPPTPEEAARLRGVTGMDDLYLVGYYEQDKLPEDQFAHGHIVEPYLFRVAHDIPDDLRAALTRRFER